MLDQEMKASECEDKDIQRNWVVELDLVPHPHLSRPELVRMDYAECGTARSMCASVQMSPATCSCAEALMHRQITS